MPRQISRERAKVSNLHRQLALFADRIETEEREKLEKLANDLKIEKIEIE